MPEIADAVDGGGLTERDLRAALNDYSALAVTLWAEARDQPIEGLVAIGHVIKNRRAHPTRYKATEPSYRGIVLAHDQFSCWTPGPDANHQALLALARRVVGGESPDDPAWRECAWVAVGIIEDRLRDRAQGSTHYLTQDLYRDHPPIWATRLRWVADLGSHVFLIEPPEPSLTQRA